MIQWRSEFGDNNYLFESTANVNDEFYSWEKCFLRITFYNVAVADKFIFNGVTYQAYFDNEQIIVEITDIVRAEILNELTVTLYPGTSNYNVSVAMNVINGERQTKLNSEITPSEIPYNIPGNPFNFYVYLSESEKLVNGKWVDNTDKVWNAGLLPTYRFRRKSDQKEINLIPQECMNDKIYVMWKGHFGVYKSWIFEIEKMINSSNKELSIQTLDANFSVLKNKTTSLQVINRKASQEIQHYLADIVYSDSVFIASKIDTTNILEQVRIDNQSFEITKNKRDVSLLINQYQYDTI